MRETRERLTPTSIGLHWIVALFMLVLLAVGFYMSSFEVRSLYPLHKSLGMVALVFILWRVVNRLSNGFPPTAADYQPWEHHLAVLVHWVLLIGTVLFPLSGMLMSAMGGHGLYLFGMELYPRNPNPAMPTKDLPIDKTWAGVGHETHEILAWVMLVAIALHVAGALKHHVMDRDGTLRRMTGHGRR